VLFVVFLVVAHILIFYSFRYLLEPCEFLSELRLLREYLRILIVFGLIHGAVAPSFFYKTALSMSENLSIVVKNP
jgi:hypothetical protein